jgi:flagellar hook protein FlgE
MADSMSIAKTGIKQATQNMATLANNMALSKSIAGRGSNYFMNAMTEGVDGTIMGVTGTLVNNISQPGKTVSVTDSLWCAAGNNGYFVVDNGFTRVGTWRFDDTGTCINHLGNQLMAYRVNADGQKINPDNVTQTISDNTTQTYMSTINTKNLRLNATATSNITYGYQLPVNSTNIGGTVRSDVTVFDSMGNQHNLTFTFKKAEVYDAGGGTHYVVPPGGTAGDITTNINATTGCASAWYLSISSGTTGDVVNTPYTGNGMLVEFDADGNPLNFNNSTVVNTGSPVTVSASPANLSIAYGNNSTAGNISLDLGTLGQNNGIVSRGNTAKVINVQADGNSDGIFSSLEWTTDGYGVVTFDNNVQQKMFQIAMAYFPNSNGLAFDSNGVYKQSVDSGKPLYGVPNDGNIGPISVSAYEESNISAIDTQVDIIDNQRFYMGQIASFRSAKEALTALDNL